MCFVAVSVITGVVKEVRVSPSEWESVHSKAIVEETGDSIFSILMNAQDIVTWQCDWSLLLRKDIVKQYTATSKSNKKSIER